MQFKVAISRLLYGSLGTRWETHPNSLSEKKTPDPKGTRGRDVNSPKDCVTCYLSFMIQSKKKKWSKNGETRSEQTQGYLDLI